MSSWPEVSWNGPQRRSAPALRAVRESNAEVLSLAQMAREAPRVPWDVFTRDVLRWSAGEHFALIGPTGQGKTTMLQNILPIHQYVTVFATKPRDVTMDNLIASGYVRMERWVSADARNYPRRVLWPDARGMDSFKTQHAVFADAMQRIYREGGWTVAIDELWYFSNILKMDSEIKMYLLQGRSLGISLVCATQRPAWVPLEVYDQSTHLMFWRDNDEANLARISGIGTRSSALVRNVVSNLDRFQVLYVNTRTGEMARTRCPEIPPLAERR